MGKRFKNAIEIQEGASNPLAVSIALVEAIREVNAERGSVRLDPAVLLIQHQLEHLIRSSVLNTSISTYSDAVAKCKEQMK